MPPPRRPATRAYGARWTPCSVTIAAISSAGVTSKAGFRAANRAVTSSPARSSIGISVARRRRQVDGRARCDDVERDSVVGGEDGERVGADLVRGVAVGGDPVGAGDDRVDLAAGHHQTRQRSRRSPRAGCPPARAPRRSGGRPGAAAASRRRARARAAPAPRRPGAHRPPSRSRRSRARRRCSASGRACRARAGAAACPPSAGSARPRRDGSPAPARPGRRPSGASRRAPRRG